MIKQLQDLGMDDIINQAWIKAISECAEAERIDLRAASYRVAQDLNLHSSLKKNIEQAQQQLAVLNTQQEAIRTLNALQSQGCIVSGDIRLTKFVDLARFGKDMDRQQRGWKPNGAGANNKQHADYSANMFS